MGPSSASSKSLSPPKLRTNYSGTRQEAKQNAVSDARDEQDYLFRRSEELRARRLASLKERSSAVRRFLKTLHSLGAECECTGYRDCDLDLAGLAAELDLRDVGEQRDLFILSVEAHEWIIGLAKRRGMKRQAYYDSADYFDVSEVAMDELNAYLGLH